MRNFLKIAEGVDCKPLALSLARQQELWGAYGVRNWHPQSAHRGISDIILRYNKFDGKLDDYVEAVCANLSVENYPAWPRLPEAVELIHLLMGRVRGLELGRAMISRLLPGASIPPHSDRIKEGELQFPHRVPPAVYYDRYHVVVNSAPGMMFRCGDETLMMKTGEVWWFNNQLEHEVVNNSPEERLHLVVDIHSAQGVYTPPYARVEDCS